MLPGESFYIEGAKYRDGNGVSLDRKIAGSLFIQSAEKHFPQGMAWIALLSKGAITGFTEDFDTYRKWESELENNNNVNFIIERANNGDIDAQYTLGVMYEEGCATPLDFKLSVHWYTK